MNFLGCLPPRWRLTASLAIAIARTVSSLSAGRAREVAPGGHRIRGHDPGPGGGGGHHGGQPDGARAEDDDLLTGADAGPVQGVHRD